MFVVHLIMVLFLFFKLLSLDIIACCPGGEVKLVNQ